MRRLFALLALLPLLTACAERGAFATAPDYSAQAARAGATVSYATAAANATQEARAEADRHATRQAAQTRQASDAEIARIEAELNATRQVYYLRQTQEAAAYYAAASAGTATSQVAATATAWQITATPLYATQAAIVRQVRADEARAEIEQQNQAVWALVEPLVILMLAATACAIIYKFSSTLLEWTIRLKDRRARLYETRAGPVYILTTDDGLEVPQLLAALNTRPVQSASDASDVNPIPVITVMGKPWNPPEKSDTTFELARQLVSDAMAAEGPESDRLPGWRKLDGWNSDRWQRAVAALSQAGAVAAGPTGTVVTGGYDSLEGVLYALDMKQLRLRPAPYPAAARAE